jgi:hypothetical protein
MPVMYSMNCVCVWVILKFKKKKKKKPILLPQNQPTRVMQHMLSIISHFVDAYGKLNIYTIPFVAFVVDALGGNQRFVVLGQIVHLLIDWPTHTCLKQLFQIVCFEFSSAAACRPVNAPPRHSHRQRVAGAPPASRRRAFATRVCTSDTPTARQFPHQSPVRSLPPPAQCGSFGTTWAAMSSTFIFF